MTFRIVEQARAKINLALHVLKRRPDGYHELDSLVAFASCGDVLSLQPASATSLSITGPFAAGLSNGPDNLVLKAHEALSHHMAIPKTAFHLEKNLPVASGIGGGSADAAAALRGLLRLAQHGIDPKLLHEIALSLGADVPVCLGQACCRMQGVGEIITRVQQPPAPAIVLVNPNLACATADVFRALGLKPGDGCGEALDIANPSQWRNDLEQPAIQVLPEIAGVLAVLRQHQQLHSVRMSGSGATCFGLASSLASAEEIAGSIRHAQPHWWVAAASLS